MTFTDGSTPGTEGHGAYEMPQWRAKVTETRQPAAKDIQGLVAFLPKLYADGFEPVAGYTKGGKNKNGVITLSYPIYDELVDNFVDFIYAQNCWVDYNYLATTEKLDLKDPLTIANATMPQIQALITFFLQGEKFCDGFWGDMIETGYIRQLLERLSEMEQESRDSELTK